MNQSTEPVFPELVGNPSDSVDPRMREEDRTQDVNPQVYLETFGCQMNILDSELVEDSLKSRGYAMTDDAKSANVVLFNTCSVRDLSEQKVRSRLGVLKDETIAGRDVVIGVLGCMAERANKDILRVNPHINLLAGPSKLDEVPDLVDSALGRSRIKSGMTGKRGIALSNFRHRKGKSGDAALMEDLEALDNARSLTKDVRSKQAYVRITRGCNKYCAYCVVPRTRGPEMHRHPDALVNEVRALADKGVLEVTLLGQTINHYNYIESCHPGIAKPYTEPHRDDRETKTTSFAQLLKRIHDEVPHMKRIRFMTSYPRDFTNEALDVMAESPRICKYLHIPAQSGCDRVLQRMNRGYTRAEYMDLIKRAKARMPGISILGDMIVGFPTETDEEFEETLALMREVQYKNLFVFKYSPRPGTVADKRDEDDIPWNVKKVRNKRMLELQKEISLRHHQAMIGNIYDVIVEGEAKNGGSNRLAGRTDGDHLVVFDGDKALIGQIIPIRMTEATALALRGEPVY